MAHLPSLAGLRLGPPTGPMARFGEVLEPPSPEADGGKRAKGNDGLTVSIVKWDPESEQEDHCPISLHKFALGEPVYKLPEPNKPTPYDPWTIHKMWMQEDGSNDEDHLFYNPLTRAHDIPHREYAALSEWVNNHDESERIASPEPSPIRPDQVFHNPIVDGVEFVQRQQPPVDLMEGMLAETMVGDGSRLRQFQNLGAGEFSALCLRMMGGDPLNDMNFLLRWAVRIGNFLSSRRTRGLLPRDTEDRYSAGFVTGNFEFRWDIGNYFDFPRRSRPNAITENEETGYQVTWNNISIMFQVHPDFVGRHAALGEQFPQSELSLKFLSAFLSESAPEGRQLIIRHDLAERLERDFTVYLLREGGDIDIPEGQTNRRAFTDSDELSISIEISTELFMAMQTDHLKVDDDGRFSYTVPTSREMEEAHYGTQKEHHNFQPFPAFWSLDPGDRSSRSQEDINASKQTLKSSIAFVLRCLFKAVAGPRNLYLAAPIRTGIPTVVEEYYSSLTRPTQELANFVVDRTQGLANFASWETHRGMVGERARQERSMEITVPFWFAEAVSER